MVSKKRQKPATNKKKSKGAPKVNPFELKFNRSKYDVLGKKKSAAGVGHPGLSRKRAYEQREKTLGVEYDRIGKVNKIVDKRIGEKNKNITSEEKASLRFAAERAKHLKKGSKFNLTDDNEENEELLTHGGRALTDIQKYDKTIASDDEDDGNGNIGADVETVTEDLDAKYLKLLDKVKGVFRPVGATKAEKSDKDDYDKLAFSLKIDADSRATPAERTKTAEELAVEERHYLEEMESLRRARMNAEGHHSVDAEQFDDKLKKKAKKVGFEVRFGSDGKLLNSDKLEPVSKKKVAIDSDEELTDEEEEDQNEEDLDDLIEEHDADADLDVPFVFEMPRKFEALVKLLNKYPARKIDRKGNKKLLSKLFLFVLRYSDDLSNGSLSADNLAVLGFLTKAMFSLLKFDVEFSVRCVRALIRQNWKKRMDKPKSPTQFSLINLLRLIASLFPVSDRWHPVCSPAMALAAVTLAKCQVLNLAILARQILLATVVSDYVEESRRYVPEAIAFCQGALLMAVENEESERAPSVVFPISMPHKRMLYIEK
ncbi:hypothetical protein OSTOST_12391, partial [Ostertagia ostertagi]